MDEKQADQQFFESNEFQSTNKEVDNILRSAEAADSSQPAAAPQQVNVEEAKWDDDSLGSLDEELDAQGGATDAAPGEDGAAVDAQESEIFVPPSPGPDPYQAILR